jgi:AraC family transcriptional regulator
MEWIDRLNQAITYIEKNLEGTIDYNEAAKIACCSTFQFQRMFSYIAGVALSEYIRRRRMSKAAFELQNSAVKILDLAVKYGYDSPTSFSRAFQNIHQITPSNARQRGIILKNYPKLVFGITIKGDTEMQYRIEEKKPLRIVGVRKRIGMVLEKNFETVPEFWKGLRRSKQFSSICGLMNQSPNGILGVTVYQSPKDFFHYIAVASDKRAPEGMFEHEIPAATWAIFECSEPFPNSIQELYRRFYTEWLPFSGYEYAETYDIEVYPMDDWQVQKVEVWFSIKDPKKFSSACS